jgi:N-methylhydantoinase B
VLRVRLAGGGGHGDPFARSTSSVLDDVREDKMSIQHAREAYGVVISGGRGSPLEVDGVATAVLRTGQRTKQ